MPDPMTDIQKQYRKILYTALAVAACMIFGLFSLLYQVLIGVTLIAAAAVLYFTLYRPNRRAYSDLVTRTNLERTICRLIDSPPPEPVGGDVFTRQILADSNLIPESADNTAPLYCWEMKGHRKGFTVSLADTTMIQKYMAANGRYTYHTSSGVFCVLGLPSDSHRYFLVMDRQFLPDTVREMFMNTKPEYVTGPIGDEDLDERYFLYRSTRDEQDPVPAPFFQSLKRLMNYTPGQAAVSVRGNTMYAFINNRFVSQRIPLSRTFTTENLDTDQFPELSYIINIAATLGGGRQDASRKQNDNAENKPGTEAESEEDLEYESGQEDKDNKEETQ